jgi:amidase
MPCCFVSISHHRLSDISICEILTSSNGLWGFKPTTKRIPRAGLEGITSTSRVAGTIGPVCHSVADMELFFRVIFDAQPWKTDITLVNEPWRPVEESGKGLGYEGWSGAGGKLRVGVMRDDGMVRPVKPVRRAMDATVEALVSSGLAEIVEMEPMGFEEGWELTVSDCLLHR